MLKHAHYFHIPVHQWTGLSGRHTLPHAPHHSCVRFHPNPLWFTSTTTMLVFSEQHFRLWGAIQSFILNTVEQRICFADRMLSRWGSLDLRTSDIRHLCWTSFVPSGSHILAQGAADTRLHKLRQGTLSSNPGWKRQRYGCSRTHKILYLVIR